MTDTHQAVLNGIHFTLYQSQSICWNKPIQICFVIRCSIRLNRPIRTGLFLQLWGCTTHPSLSNLHPWAFEVAYLASSCCPSENRMLIWQPPAFATQESGLDLSAVLCQRNPFLSLKTPDGIGLHLSHCIKWNVPPIFFNWVIHNTLCQCCSDA